MFRDEIPWLYDIGMETYRAMKSGNAKQADAALREFQKLVDLTMRGPMIEFLETSPKNVMFLREALERISHRYRLSRRMSAERKVEEMHE